MENKNKKKPGVGVGVMLFKENKILLGLRNVDPEKADSELHGEGTWTMPGGKIHFGETYKDAAYREVFEETGIKINRDLLKIVCINDDILPDVHFVTIGLLCNNFEGEPKVKEPDEILEWRWFDLNKLPKNIYLPSQKIINYFASQYNRKFVFSLLHPEKWKEYFKENQKVIFTSIPSTLFSLRGEISKFVLESGFSVFNPYMNFEYNLMNTVKKEKIRIANNSLIKKSDELWVFIKDISSLSDGILFEIQFAKELGKKVSFFSIYDFNKIKAEIKWPVEEYYGYKLREYDMPIVYVATSSKIFHLRIVISKFVLSKNKVPLNPFMNFDYFLADKVKKEKILIANSTHVSRSNEFWVFGPISDGVLAEIKLAKSLNKPIRYFKIIDNKEIKEISKDEVEFEEDLKKYREEL